MTRTADQILFPPEKPVQSDLILIFALELVVLYSLAKRTALCVIGNWNTISHDESMLEIVLYERDLPQVQGKKLMDAVQFYDVESLELHELIKRRVQDKAKELLNAGIPDAAVCHSLQSLLEHTDPGSAQDSSFAGPAEHWRPLQLGRGIPAAAGIQTADGGG